MSIVDKLLSTIGSPTVTPITASPAAQNSQQSAMTPAAPPTAPTEADYQNVATRRLAGEKYGLDSATEAEKDLSTLNGVQIMDKYGAELGLEMLARQAGESTRQLDGSTSVPMRSSLEATGDTAVGLGVGATNLVGGVAAFGGSLIDPNLGVGISHLTQDVAKLGHNMQSDSLNQVRADDAALMGLAARDNKQIYDQNIASGDNSYWAGAKRIGSDFTDQGAISLSSAAGTGDLVAEGLGSMLPIGTVAKGVSTLGNIGRNLLVKSGALADAGLVTAADVAAGSTRLGLAGQKALTLADVGTSKGALGIADRVGSFAKVPTVVAAAEGGSIIGETYDATLKAGGTEEQALAAANEARNKQAVIGFATGTLVRKFEANPFAKQTPRKVLSNTAREVGEEGTQEGTAALSQNQAVANQGLGNGDVLAGVGSGAFKGALGGLGSTAVLGAPALASGVAKTTAKGVTAAVGWGLDKTFSGLEATANKKAAAEIAAKATGIVQNAPAMQTAVDTAQVSIPTNATPEEAAAIQSDNAELSQYTEKLRSVLSFEQPPPGSMPASFETALVGATTALDVIHGLLGVAKDETASPEDRINAMASVGATMAEINDVFEADGSILTRRNEYAGVSEYVNQYADILDEIMASPLNGHITSVSKNLFKTDGVIANLKPITGKNHTTPEGQDTLNAVFSMMQMGGAEDNVDLEAKFNDIVELVKQGAVKLTPEQGNALKGIQAIKRAGTARKNAMIKAGLPNVSKVVSNIVLDNNSKKGGTFSISAYVSRITNAYNKGDRDSATTYLRALATFAQSMNNKAEALNKHANGSPDAIPNPDGKGTVVHYKTRQANAKNKFKNSTRGVYTNFSNAQATNFGKTVFADAQAVTEAYNTMLKAFPDLAPADIGALITPEMHKGFTANNVSNVNTENKSFTQATKDTSTTATTQLAKYGNPAVQGNTELANTNEATVPSKGKVEAKADKSKTPVQKLANNGKFGKLTERKIITILDELVAIQDDAIRNTQIKQLDGFIKNIQNKLGKGKSKLLDFLVAQQEIYFGKPPTKKSEATKTEPTAKEKAQEENDMDYMLNAGMYKADNPYHEDLYSDSGRPLAITSARVREFKEKHGINYFGLRALRESVSAGKPITIAEAKVIEKEAIAEAKAKFEADNTPEARVETDKANLEKVKKAKAEVDQEIADLKEELGGDVTGTYVYADTLNDQGEFYSNAQTYTINSGGTITIQTADNSIKPIGSISAKHGDIDGRSILFRIKSGELVKADPTKNTRPEPETEINTDDDAIPNTNLSANARNNEISEKKSNGDTVYRKHTPTGEFSYEIASETSSGFVTLDSLLSTLLFSSSRYSLQQVVNTAHAMLRDARNMQDVLIQVAGAITNNDEGFPEIALVILEEQQRRFNTYGDNVAVAARTSIEDPDGTQENVFTTTGAKVKKLNGLAVDKIYALVAYLLFTTPTANAEDMVSSEYDGELYRTVYKIVESFNSINLRDLTIAYKLAGKFLNTSAKENNRIIAMFNRAIADYTADNMHRKMHNTGVAAKAIPLESETTNAVEPIKKDTVKQEETKAESSITELNKKIKDEADKLEKNSKITATSESISKTKVMPIEVVEDTAIAPKKTDANPSDTNSNSSVNTELQTKLESKLKELYPEINLSYTTDSIEEDGSSTVAAPTAIATVVKATKNKTKTKLVAIDNTVVGSETVSTVEEVFPDLLGGDNNAFYQAFTVPKTSRSKLMGLSRSIGQLIAGFRGNTKSIFAEEIGALPEEYSAIRSSYAALLDGFNTTIRGLLEKSLEDFNKKQLISSRSKVATVAKFLVRDTVELSKFTKAIQETITELAENGSVNPLVSKEDEAKAVSAIESYRGKLLKGEKENSKLKAALEGNGQLWGAGKALNITRLNAEGKLEYDRDLIGSALVAAAQWYIDNAVRANAQTYTKKQLAAKFRLDERNANSLETALLKEANGHLTMFDLVSGLRDKINQYWGLTANPDAVQGYTLGIAEAIALEIVKAMRTSSETQVAGLTAKVISIDPTAENGLTNRASATFVAFNMDMDSAALIHPTMLDDIALTENENKSIFIEDEEIPVRKTQMHSSIATTEEQNGTMERNNQVKFVEDIGVTAILQGMGEAALIDTFGAGVLNEKLMNVLDFISKTGVNTGIASAFAELNRVLQYMKLNKTTAVRYAHEVSSVSRLQQRGVKVPQSDKLMRIALTATKTVADVSDMSSYATKYFMIGIAQALGIKVHRIATLENLYNDLGVILQKPEVIAAIDLLRDPPKDKYSAEENAIITAAVKATDNSFASLQALNDFANFMSATPEQRKTFTSHVFIEADGVTNGIANTLILVNPYAITAQDITNWGRIGYYINQTGMTLNKFAQGGDRGSVTDIYTEVVIAATEKIKLALNNLKIDLATAKTTKERGTAALNLQANTHIATLLGMFGDGISMGANGELVLTRNYAKPPTTVINYAAGLPAVTDTMLNGVLDNMSARFSDALALIAAVPNTPMAFALFGSTPNPQESFQKFLEAFDFLSNHKAKFDMGTFVGMEKTTYPTVMSKMGIHQSMGVGTLRNFVLSPFLFSNISTTLRVMHGTYVHKAVLDTLGDGARMGMEVLQRATNAHTAIISELFKEKVRELLSIQRDIAKKENKQFSESNFLSKNQLKQLARELKQFAPYYSTATQSIDTTSDDFSILGKDKRLASTLDSSSHIPIEINGMGAAGVSGLAKFLLAMGDAQMIQAFSNYKELQHEDFLAVFDGIHGNINNFGLISQMANKAVFESWTTDNPLAAVGRGLAQLLEHFTEDDLAAMSHTAIKALDSALGESHPSQDPHEVFPRFKHFADTVITLGERVTARQTVMKTLKASVHQMAADTESYQTEGTVELEGTTAEEQATALNELVKAELEKHSKVIEEPITEDLTSAFDKGNVNSLLIDKESDTARIVGVAGVFQIIDNSLATLPENQKRVVKVLKRALVGSDLKLVFGTSEQVMNQAKIDGQVIPFGSVGAFASASNTVYLISPTSEVLLHELIHAVTLQALFTYFRNPSVASKELAAAVKAIEQMRDEFLSPNTRDKLRAKTQWLAVSEKYEAVERVINHFLDEAANSQEGSVEQATALTGALGEFMAYALANRQLSSKVLKGLPALTKWLNGVKTAIKKLLGINRADLLDTLDTMFDSLLFATEIVATSQENNMVKLQNNIGVYQHSGFGADKRLQGINDSLDHLITDIYALKAYKVAFTETADTAANLAVATFTLTPQETMVFRKMLAVMKANIRLNGSAQTKAQQLYAHVMQHLTPADLQEDDSDQEVFHAKAKFDFLTKQGTGERFSTFMALATTSTQLQQVLKKIPKIKPEKSTKTGFDATIAEYANKAISLIADKTHAVVLNGSVHALLAETIHSMLAATSKANTFIESIRKIEDKIPSANRWARKNIDEISRKTGDFIVSKTSPNEPRATRFAKNLAVVAIRAMDSDLSSTAIDDLSKAFETKDLNPTVRSALNDLIGRTESNADVFDLIKPIKGKMAQDRQAHIEEDPALIQSKFSRNLTDVEWAHLHTGLAKTDLAAFTPNQVVELLKGRKSMQHEQARLEAQIANLSPRFAKLFLAKAKQLANFLSTGVAGNNLQRNGFAIANRAGSFSGMDASEDLVKAVDRLTSLYAYENLNQKTKDALEKLARTEANGVKFLTAYLKALRAADTAKLGESTTAKLNQYKGFRYDYAKADGELVVRGIADRKTLLDQGFIEVGKYKGDSRDTQASRMAYYFLPTSISPRYKQGLLQNIQVTSGGVNLATNRTVGRNVVGIITRDTDVDNIINNKQLGVVHNNEFLLPIYDAIGNISGYERSVDPKQLERFKYSTRIDSLAGRYRGRQAEENFSHNVNHTIATHLKAMYDTDMSKGVSKTAYVDLFDEAYLATDPVLKDAISRITEWSRNNIAEVFGDKFLVRKSMVQDVVGYSSASIADSWTGNSRWSKDTQIGIRNVANELLGKGALHKLLIAESAVESTVSWIKDIIVTKSGVVLLANILSNIVQLKLLNVTFQDMVSNIPGKITEAEYYTNARKRINKLRAELVAAKYENSPSKVQRLENELASINVAIKALSIYPLIVSGEFNSITDSDSSAEQLENYGKFSIQALMNKALNATTGVPRDILRYGSLAHDTTLYQNMQKAVFYGDFIAKSLYYDKLVKDGKTSKQALAIISEEFIHYDRLGGRTREKLENVGLLWFYNYKLRSVKIAARLIRDNPLNALLGATLTPDSIGTVVNANAFSKLLDGTIGSSVGIDMGLRGVFMNPWMNLLD